MRSKRFPILFLLIVGCCFLVSRSFRQSRVPSANHTPNTSPAKAPTKLLTSPSPAAPLPAQHSVPATEILKESIASLREAQFAPHENDFEAFNGWAADMLEKGNVSPDNIAEGIKLAERRRDDLSDTIQSHPDRAIELTFPRELRNVLPSEVLAIMEKPFSSRADLAVLAALPAPGQTVRPVERRLILEGKSYDAYVYGRRLGEPTKFNTPVYGITLGDYAAVAEDPVRPMSVAEVNLFKASRSVEDIICSYSGLPTTSLRSETIVEAEGEIFPLCGPSHSLKLSNDLAAAGGETVGPGLLPGETAASPYTEGTKTLVIIRVDFDDMPGDPFSLNSGTNLVTGLNTFYRTMSYNKTGFAPLGQGSVITPTFRMPETAAFYGSNDATLLRSAARDAARAAGYNLGNYQFDLICFDNVPGFGWAGLGYVGAPGSWIRGSADVGVTAHELGHNFGLNHANFWDTAGQSTIGSGSSVEYGDKFDTMGNAAAGGKHFNARYKAYLNWLTTTEVRSFTTNGTYRLNPHDRSNSTGLRALRITKNSNTNYWVEFRANYGSNKWLTNGVTVRWAGNGNENSNLLDNSPGSNDGTDDAALLVGRTFSDKTSGIHITPVGIGAGNSYVDVVVNKGTFATNLPPIVTLVSDRTNTTVNGTINFETTVVDPNGDKLAYYWEFGDGTFSTNSATVAKRWSATGEYVVQCFVSDMKGGVSSRAQVVRIGSPTTYRISGRVMNGSDPVEGVLLTAGARSGVTDSDGRYYITGLPAGSYTLKAAREGHVFTRSGFSNPLTVGPSRDTANFFAIPSNAQTTFSLVPGGSVWQFWDRGTSPGSSWKMLTFNDTTWNKGPAPLGYGEDNEKTKVSFGPNANAKYITTYFRKKFVVENKANIAGLTLGLKRDDGGIVYLNNREVFRSNMPGGAVGNGTLATSAVGGGDESTFFETEVDPTWLNNGTNILAVEIHQSSGTSSDVVFDLKLLGINAEAAVPPPTVQFQIVGNSLRLTWPDSALVWSVASSPDLDLQGQGGTWSLMQVPISLSNGQRSATIPLEEGQKFFRLQR